MELPQVWESEILAYEAADLRSPPPSGAVVFTGSSSIRMWTTLGEDMAPLTVINRGFGGAQVDAVVHFAGRIVLPYRPRAVVLCAGENDLESHRSKTPEDVLDDVRRFGSLLDCGMPAARLFVLALKPSPVRAAVWPAVQRLNRLLEAWCQCDGRRHWVDVSTPMFGADGARRRELFLDDGLHLSGSGYALWTSILRPPLLAALG